MTTPTWWPRFTAWLRTAGQSLLDGLSMSVWGPEDIEYVYRRRHAEAIRMATDRARERETLEVAPAEATALAGVDDLLLRELVRSVAQATIEYVAEQDYDGPADMFAERKQLAEEVARFTMACAAEEEDVAVNAVRRAMR